MEVYAPIPEELLHRTPRAVRMVGRIVLVVLLGAALIVAAVAVLRFAFREQLPPNLFERPTLTQGKTYRYRIPLGQCALPIVGINGRNWKPDTPWAAPFPKNWHITTEGSHYHEEQYLVGTVRLEPHRLVISLPDGTVVNYYHPTTQRQGFCA